MRQKRWGREKEREGNWGKLGVRCMLAHLTEFPYGLWSSLPLPLVYFPLVLLPVRSSLSFPSHTSPILCQLNLAHYIYLCCFICHKKWWSFLRDIWLYTNIIQHGLKYSWSRGRTFSFSSVFFFFFFTREACLIEWSSHMCVL